MFSWHILPLTPFPKSPLWVFPLPINKFRYFPVFLFLSFHFVCSFFKMSSLTARVLIATFSVGAPTFASLAHILPLSVRSAFTTVFLLFLLKCPTGIHLKFSSLSTHVSPIKIWWKICFFYGVMSYWIASTIILPVACVRNVGSLTLHHLDISLFFCLLSFVVVQSLSHVRLFVIPRTAACQASLSFTISWSLLKLMAIE